MCHDWILTLELIPGHAEFWRGMFCCCQTKMLYSQVSCVDQNTLISWLLNSSASLFCLNSLFPNPGNSHSLHHAQNHLLIACQSMPHGEPWDAALVLVRGQVAAKEKSNSLGCGSLLTWGFCSCQNVFLWSKPGLTNSGPRGVCKQRRGSAAQAPEAAPRCAVGSWVTYVTTSPQAPSFLTPSGCTGILQVLQHMLPSQAFCTWPPLSLECSPHPSPWVLPTYPLGPAKMSLPQGCLLWPHRPSASPFP